MQIISIKNKLDFWGLDGHNNVHFTAYGSQWLNWHEKRKITKSQELHNSKTFKLKLTVPNIFQLIPQTNIDIIIVGLHFQCKQYDVNNSIITQYIYLCQTLCSSA